MRMVTPRRTAARIGRGRTRRPSSESIEIARQSQYPCPHGLNPPSHTAQRARPRPSITSPSIGAVLGRASAQEPDDFFSSPFYGGRRTAHRAVVGGHVYSARTSIVRSLSSERPLARTRWHGLLPRVHDGGKIRRAQITADARQPCRRKNSSRPAPFRSAPCRHRALVGHQYLYLSEHSIRPFTFDEAEFICLAFPKILVEHDATQFEVVSVDRQGLAVHCYKLRAYNS